MMRRILAALFLVVFSVRAMAGTITVLDGNGNPQTYQVFTNPSGNFLGSVVSCDPTSTSNCISVNASGQQTIILVPVGQPNDTAAASGSVSGSVISILKGILTNVLTPINVTGSFSVSSPLGVNIAATTPLNVTVASSPLNVTGNLTANPTGQNIAQLAGQTLASPSTYGIAPVGSVQGINGFITNNVNVTPPTPLNVTVGNTASPAGVAVVNNASVTPPTPLQVTLPASPITVAISTSPQGVAVVNTVTVTPPTPLQVTLPASPVSVGIAGPTPLNVTLVAIPGSPQAVTLPASPLSTALATGVYTSLPAASSVIAHVVTTAYGVTNTVIALGATPGVSGPKQFAMAYCQGRTTVATPPVFFLQVFDTTAHASGSDVTLGTTNAKALIAVAGSPVSVGAMPTMPAPGGQFTQGISVALTQGPFKSATAVGASVDCTFAYN